MLYPEAIGLSHSSDRVILTYDIPYPVRVMVDCNYNVIVISRITYSP